MTRKLALAAFAGCCVLLIAVAMVVSASPSGASTSAAQCAKKYKGKSKKQRQAKKKCLAKAKKESSGAGAKKPGQTGTGSPTGPTSPPSATPSPAPGPGATPSPTPTPTPTPEKEPEREPERTPEKPDTTPPSTSIVTGPTGLVDSAHASFTFSSSEAGSHFECNLDAGGWQACASPKSYDSLADGGHEFQVRAIDAAGNVDPKPAKATWTVDTVPPQTTISAAPDSPTQSSQASFTFTSDTADSTFQCNLDGAGWGACTSPKAYDQVPDGNHEFEVRAIDPAGNVDPTPAKSTWTVNTPPPTTTGGAGPTGKVAPGPVAIEFTSNEPAATFVCSLDGAAAAPCSSPDHLPDPGPGPHTFVVKAVDGAGNVDPTGASYSWDAVSPKLNLCGDIAADRTIGPRYAEAYVVTCGVTVDEGATLEVEAGALLKFESNAELRAQGKLEAIGTASEPIVFTSWRDDAAGGDTNGDGTASGPVAGDWAGIAATPGGGGHEAATLQLDHVRVSYARTAVDAYEASVSVTHSTIERAAAGGIEATASAGVPTLTGNTVDHVAQTAIAVRGGSLDMGKLDGNSGTGNGLNGVQLSGDVVTVSSALPWTGNLIPVLYGGCEALRVPPGVKLTLGAGTIVKGEANCGDELRVQGTLEAAGTTAEPVVFTSWRDDSVGGDTNGDGSATGPERGDWGGIDASSGRQRQPKPDAEARPRPDRLLQHRARAKEANTSVTASTIEKARGDGIEVQLLGRRPDDHRQHGERGLRQRDHVRQASLDMGKLTPTPARPTASTGSS